MAIMGKAPTTAVIVPRDSDSDLDHVFTHRHIVTSFICNFGGSASAANGSGGGIPTPSGSSFNDFKVAIFKRSAQTSSYQ